MWMEGECGWGRGRGEVRSVSSRRKVGPRSTKPWTVAMGVVHGLRPNLPRAQQRLGANKRALATEAQVGHKGVVRNNCANAAA